MEKGTTIKELLRQRMNTHIDSVKNFMRIQFWNLAAILRSTSRAEKIPVHFRDKETPSRDSKMGLLAQTTTFTTFVVRQRSR